MRFLALPLALALTAAAPPQAVRIDEHGVFSRDDAPVFPIGFTTAPRPGAKTPSGGDAYAELRSNGTVFHRYGPQPKGWGPAAEADLDRVMDASARAGLLVALSIPDLQAPSPAEEPELRRVVRKYSAHPALGFWKASDEPEWGKVPVPLVQRFYDIVHELDPAHPVWLTQAPRGTLESLRAYSAAYDVGAIDVYPVSYPPGTHSLGENKGLSMVGDYADMIRDVAHGKKPFWMVLQICWSGVIKPGKQLRMPTFPEERYMTYQALIHGARGLVYFGGNVAGCLNERDAALGWNWTFYQRVLRPVLDELNPKSPLHPALVAPDSDLPVKVAGAVDVELRVREAEGRIFVLAAKREGATAQVTFSGLPAAVSSGDVLYEEPRRVAVSGGSFTDWFGPNEVHVYRFARTQP
jgi:hypothetical protein